MPSHVNTITTALPYHLGSVNCYLVQTDAGYILIDTGCSNQRAALEQALRRTFDAPLAMHPADFAMITRGDMFASRDHRNPIFQAVAARLFKFGKANYVTPDLPLTEGLDLSTYGLDATVISLPGHSHGSIGLLTAGGDLFVGDPLENVKRPALNSIMDDRRTAQASVVKLRRLSVKTVYAGHGVPFSLTDL